MVGIIYMEEVVIYVPRKIENDIQGFEFLIKLYTTLKETRCKRITIDFNKTRWLEANLSAVLGVINSWRKPIGLPMG